MEEGNREEFESRDSRAIRLRLVFVHTCFLEGPALLSSIDLFRGRTIFFFAFCA